MDSPKIIDLGVVVSVSDDGVATLLDDDGYEATMTQWPVLLTVGMRVTMVPCDDEFSNGLRMPERLGLMAGFLVPTGVRERCFQPFFEDLRADRAEKIARTSTRRVKRWIECCFYFRLVVTVIQSLVCYLGDLLAKVAPFIRALFFKG